MLIACWANFVQLVIILKFSTWADRKNIHEKIGKYAHVNLFI